MAAVGMTGQFPKRRETDAVITFVRVCVAVVMAGIAIMVAGFVGEIVAPEPSTLTVVLTGTLSGCSGLLLGWWCARDL